MKKVRIQSPQKEIVEKVLEVLKKRNDFLGLFGYGSVFEDARTPSATSDIDLIAVVDSSVWEFHIFQLDGIDVELFIIDVNTIVNNVMSRDNHFEIRNIGAGKIVYCKDIIIEEIKKMADERYYKLGSFPLNKTTIFFKRVNYYDLLDKITGMQNIDSKDTQLQDINGDSSLLKFYLMDYLVERAIEDWFSLYKRYYEKPTYHIADMKRFGDMYMAEKCYEYYSLIKFNPLKVQGNLKNTAKIKLRYGGDITSLMQKKIKLCTEIINHTMGLVGGYPGNEWEIIWKEPEINYQGAEMQDAKLKKFYKEYFFENRETIKSGKYFESLLQNKEKKGFDKSKIQKAKRNTVKINLKYEKDTREIIKTILNEYTSREDILGIFFVNPKSQKYQEYLEFHIWTSSTIRKSARKIIKNKLVRIEEQNLRKFIPQLVLYNKDGIIRKFSKIDILYNRDYRINFIIEFTKRIIRKGKLPYRPEMQILRRKRSYHFIEDCRKYLENDPPVSLYVMNMVFNYTLNNYYLMSGKVKPEIIDILDDIKEKDEFLFELCEKFLLSDEYKQKLEELEKIVDYVLFPYGGKLPDEWSIPINSTFLTNFDKASASKEELFGSDKKDEENMKIETNVNVVEL